jgi:protein transport protein SEC31
MWKLTFDSRFHDIAWGKVDDSKPKGIIAGALENGALDLWSADALLDGEGDTLISRTNSHSGAIKSLQFNPFKPSLLATAGSKGELFVTDISNPASAFRLGNPASRADDFESLDWNKKIAHILVTGGSGGFVTVWDVKSKKESLTLNNQGRRPVSAVAWDPENVNNAQTRNFSWPMLINVVGYKIDYCESRRHQPCNTGMGSAKLQCT